MIYTPMTNKAMKIAYEAHDGQFDQNGVPYIFHPFHVAEGMPDEITTCVALLHDVVEDTPMTFEDLKDQFPKEVMDALVLLTHNPSIPYNDYVRAIKDNPIAKIVKLGDIAHNSDESRFDGNTNISKEQIMHWRNKYTTAKKILEEQCY